jgi:hypothetical protein
MTTNNLAYLKVQKAASKKNESLNEEEKKKILQKPYTTEGIIYIPSRLVVPKKHMKSPFSSAIGLIEPKFGGDLENYKKMITPPLDTLHLVHEIGFHTDQKVDISDLWTNGVGIFNFNRVYFKTGKKLFIEPNNLNIFIMWRGLFLISKSFLNDGTFGKIVIPFGHVFQGEDSDHAFTRIMLSTTGIQPNLNCAYRSDLYYINWRNHVFYLYQLPDDLKTHPVANFYYGDYWMWTDFSTFLHSEIFNKDMFKPFQHDFNWQFSLHIQISEIITLENVQHFEKQVRCHGKSASLNDFVLFSHKCLEERNFELDIHPKPMFEEDRTHRWLFLFSKTTQSFRTNLIKSICYA